MVTLTTHSQECLILVLLLFIRKRDKQVKFTQTFKELSNWYGGNFLNKAR